MINSTCLAFEDESYKLTPYKYSDKIEYQGQKDRYDVTLLQNDKEVLVANAHKVVSVPDTVRVPTKAEQNGKVIVTARVEDESTGSSVNVKCTDVNDTIICNW